MSRLSVGLVTSEGASLVRLVGELDISSAELLLAMGAIQGPVVVDCHQLTFVDSGGFAALAKLSAESVALARVAPEVRQVLHVMNISGAVSIIDDAPSLL